MRKLIRWFGCHVALLLIVSGSTLILYAAGTKLYTGYRQNVYIQKYESGQAQETAVPQAGAAMTVPKGTALPDMSVVLQEETEEGEQGDPSLLGVLRLPKIGLSVAIGAGVSSRTLHYTVGYFNDTALPGESGNCCIIGHRSYM